MVAQVDLPAPQAATLEDSLTGLNALFREKNIRLTSMQSFSNYTVITAQRRGRSFMKTNVIRIGNSRGIRIPKTVLEQCHLRDEVEIEVVNNHLVVRSATKPRSGWEDAFREMHERGDDTLLDRESQSPSHWDETDWQW